MPHPEPRTITELLAEVDAATEQHALAEHAMAAARSASTSAINRVNAAQRALDAALCALRTKAPGNLEWSQENYSRAPRLKEKPDA